MARAGELRVMRAELKEARRRLAKDLLAKKARVVEKLRELRSNPHRAIEEIYKYTDEIILEEENEDDEDGNEEDDEMS
jgi:hypothetical protein